MHSHTFWALWQELKSNLDSVPELSAIVGAQGCQAVSAAARSASAEEQSGALKQAYCGLMTRGKEEVSEQVTKLRERLELEKTVSASFRNLKRKRYEEKRKQRTEW